VADGWLFAIGDGWSWNALDFLLVLFSVADIAANGTESSVAAVTIGRLMRLTRFVRLWRITRVMKHFSSLRVVLFPLLGSLGQLFWCSVLIAFIVYVFAVLFLYGAAEHFDEQGDSLPADAVSLEMREWYSGVHDVMNVLFMCICGGLDWVQVYHHWRIINAGYGFAFLLYIFFMHFGVVNVVTATFVTTTSHIAAKDREQFIKTEIARMDEYMKRVMQFFKEADADGSGTLSWDEFEKHISAPRVRAYFQALELDVTQAHLLFEMLDTDNNNAVAIDEFIDGCVRLRGGARSVDLNMILLQAQKLSQQMQLLHKNDRKQFELISELAKAARLGPAPVKQRERESAT